ncbi:MAG: hypothetical protein IAE95_12450 [Chitinophagaceae bacterium]|nr:hypothetical protein [Chitinophagaceae bacterium]
MCCLLWQDASAQVRIGRMRGLEPKAARRKNVVPPTKPERKPEEVQVKIRVFVPSENRRELDGTFYTVWSDGNRLDYDDFRYNKGTANKFFSAKDSVDPKAVYPDYRVFYKMLSERTSGITDVEDTTWYSSVEQYIAGDGGNTANVSEAFFDSGFAFSVVIDSPAASVVNIQPVIYQVNESTWYYNISALFSKNESWMLVRSNDILAHEQIHFDIFELYARKMRKLLAETLKHNFVDEAGADLTNQISPGFEQYYQQLNDLQFEFDRQTIKLTGKNQSILEVNAQWRDRVRSEIRAMSDYAAPEGYIELK